MRVVGLGGLDDLRAARQFVAQYDITFTMLFDASLRSWEAMRIVAQPAAILLDRDGSEIKRWIGAFPEAEVLRLARARSG